jgi:CMP-N-acetylneuraminic acid synthetase
VQTLCVIPARAHSTRLPRKNWQELDGQSLVHLAASVAAAAGLRVIVASDANEWQGLPVAHCPHLCGPTDDISATIRYALNEAETRWATHFPRVVTLLPTTPLRTPELIREMLQNMDRTGCVAAVTAARTVPWLWSVGAGQAKNAWTPSPYPRSQDVRTRHLQEINTVQIAARELVNTGQRWGTPLLLTELPHWCVLDIDTQADLDETRRLYPSLMGELKTRKDFPVHIVHGVNGQEVA